MAVSGQLHHLKDDTSEEEAQMAFPTPASLPAVGRILHEIAAESQQYSLNSVCLFFRRIIYLAQSDSRKENCWFFASIIQEMFLLNFGSEYTMGAINHPTFGKARRELIKSKFYSEISSEISYISDAIFKLSNAISNPELSETAEVLCNVIRLHYVSCLWCHVIERLSC